LPATTCRSSSTTRRIGTSFWNTSRTSSTTTLWAKPDRLARALGHVAIASGDGRRRARRARREAGNRRVDSSRRVWSL
jgi:hypothetical protein